MEEHQWKASLVHNEITPEYPPEIESEAPPNVVNSLVAGGDILKKATLSWKGIDVFAPVDRGSICKRLCKKGTDDEPRIKQILFDGK